MDDLVSELEAFKHEMSTCQFNTYGIKAHTYFAWVRRMEVLCKQARALTELEAKKKAPTPPPVPVS